MRFHTFVVGAMLAVFGLNCSSEEPAPKPEEGVTEARPGALVITSPARAAFIEGATDGTASVEVKGTGATSELTINGQRAEVTADGSFHATIKPSAGLNLVVAVDGESRLDSPFVFGHFVSADTPVAHAIALDLGAQAINGAAPAASLTAITNRALTGRDLMGAIKGQTFSGNVVGAKYTYAVTGGKYAGASVKIGTAMKGLGVTATVTNVQVDGTLTLTVLGKSYARPVKITADSATIVGDAELSVDAEKGALKAAMPAAEATLEDFRFDTDNAGFPCCVDSVVSTILRPKVEEAIRDGVREQIPKALALTLDGLGLPKQLDLSAAGISDPVGLETKFDGSTFDTAGGVLSASALFGGRFAPGTPGAKAPGWLKLGADGPLRSSRPASLAVSFSVDAVNQLLFAAWGTGTLSRSLPDTAPLSGIKLTPGLPPIVSVADGGGFKVGLGEVIVEGKLSDKPITAAVTVMADLTAGTEDKVLVLTPKGEPTVAITWLKADDIADGVKNIVAIAAKEQLGKVLKPMRFPLPTIALEKLGPGFAGESLAVDAPAVSVDRTAARVGVSGAMTLVKSN